MTKELTPVTQAQCDRAVKAAVNHGLSISKIIIDGERLEVIIDNGDNGENQENVVPLLRAPRA